MDFFIKGSGTKITLTQKEFKTKGGEGSIYAKGTTAYKIYEKPLNVIPEAKISELAVLDNPNIIKPELVLLDKNNKPIGYTMRLLEDTTVLVSLFAKSFKQRNNIDDNKTLKLIKDLQNLVSFVHSKKILIVDLNEMNFLTNSSFDSIFAIDVNSYQTRNYPATAIMDTIRDRHMKGHNFNENTDWFSWAIIAFQMLIGIHPYRGSHPDFEFLSKDKRLDARMQNNVSVFQKDASLPKVCPSFDIIPPTLKGWFKDVFENGYRGIPPHDYSTVFVAIPTIKTLVAVKFDIKEYQIYNEQITSVKSYGNTILAFTKNHINIGAISYQLPNPNVKIGFTPKTNKPIAFWIEQGIKAMDLLSQKEISVPANGTKLFENEGRVYVQNGTFILELTIEEFSNVKILTRQVANVMDVLGATQIHDNFILQNCVGNFYATIFPLSGQSYQINLPELNDYQIIEAKYKNNIIVVVGKKIAKNKSMSNSNKFDRLVFRLSNDYKKYEMWKTTDIVITGINFAVADHGVAVIMTEDESLEAFSIKSGSSVKKIEDNALSQDMQLFNRGSGIMFYRGNKIYTISMKP